MKIVSTNIPGKDGTSQFAIAEIDQNSLKGLMWGASGAVLTTGALILTAATVAGIVAATGAAVSGVAAGVVFQHTRILTGPTVLAAAGTAAAIVDYLAVKFTGYCLSNAIHHLGPKYQVVKS